MPLLYTAGTARGGTNYRTLILNNHSQVRMSLDPFIPLFRYYRDSLLKSIGKSSLLEEIPYTNVLDDYYFSVDKQEIMNGIQSADPDIPFDQSNWNVLKNAIASRMSLASMNLIPYIDELPAPTFRQVFKNTMKVINAASEDSQPMEWTGFNDNWTMEFIPLIAQLIPDAKFMLHLRDPRAVVYSSEYAEPDPAKRPTVLSFARHLRKHFAFGRILPKHPALINRLLITQYEPFIVDPEHQSRRMTDFLEIEYEYGMADVGKFRKANGEAWPSNNSDYSDSTESWRTAMPVEMIELTEFVCCPEMQLFGYKPVLFDAAKGLSDTAFDFAIQNSRECLGWRTDYTEIERMLGSELCRGRFLKSNSTLEDMDIQRSFLFSEVYAEMREKIN